MADEPLDNDANDELLLTDEVEPKAPEDQDSSEQHDEDEEEDILTFGDGTEPEEGDTNLVRHLREELKKREKALAEARKSAPREEPVIVGDKPTIAGCDYDEEAYEQQLDAWKERKAAAERQQAEQGKATETEQQQWATELQRYNDGKASLGFKDVADAEDTVKATLSLVQQAVLVKAADDPAKVMYALGKHPDRLAQLAGIEDPLKLAAAIARLEGSLKMVKRRKAPEPEQIERGSAPVPANLRGDEKKLAGLEAKFDKGELKDRTEIVRLRRKLNKS